MVPRFSHFLHSNQAPSEYETREIKALKVYPLEEISRIDEEIKRIESILDSLKRQRASHQKSIDDCNTILAPVRRLSMDVWGVIFSHCLVTHRNPIMDASEAPMLLTQICHDWRSIALSIPRLWSRLHVPILGGCAARWGEPLPPIFCDERRIEARSEEVQRWLKLSAACPLSITIIPTSSDSHQPSLDAIIQSSRRWKQLELGFLHFNSNVWKRISNLSADDLCMLRELRLHSTSNMETAEGLWCESGVFSAQGLRSIFLAEIDQINMLPRGIPPNWKNLKHLFIHSPIALGLINEILSHCCNLVTCLLKVAPQWNSWSYQGVQELSMTLSSFRLPHLQFLSLQGSPTSMCGQIFRKIEARSLRFLHCNGGFPTEIEASGLMDFLQNINSLEILIIDCESVSGYNPLNCGTLVPSVTHLILGPSPKHRYSYHSVFHSPNIEMGEFITALYKIKHQYSPHSSPTVLFPSLEVMEAYDIRSVTDATLLELIITRIDATRSNATVAKLRKVLVQFSRQRQIDIVPEALNYARAAGIELELELTYYVTTKPSVHEWSPSFGVSDRDDASWMYSSYDSCFAISKNQN